MKKGIHIYIGSSPRDYKLNYDLIIKDLSKGGLIDKTLVKTDWKENLIQIIDEIKQNYDKFIGKRIPICVELSQELINNDDYFNRSISRHPEERAIDASSPSFQIFKIISLLNRNIDTALNSAFTNSSLWSVGQYFDVDFSDRVLDDFYQYAKKYLSRRDNRKSDYHKLVPESEAKEILKKLEKKISNNKITIEIEAKYFIRRFLDKIDLYTELAPESIEEKNEEFIDKFKKIRKAKQELLDKFFNLTITGFSLALLIIISLIFSNLGNDKTINDFIEGFLGGGIYVLSLEILIVTLSIFSLKIYKFYSKLVELYDSHISMIESDIHYQTDPQLTSSVPAELVFQMRKENTQKIHSLPDKAIGVFNSKSDIQSTLGFSEKIIDKLIGKI